MESQVPEQDILEDLSEYLKTIQTVYLTTVEQDEIGASADRDDRPLANSELDVFVNDIWCKR